jgi:phosphoheptose isomerase
MSTTPDIPTQIAASLTRSIDAKRRLHTCIGDIEQAANVVRRAIGAGSKLLIFGNGGSASDAQHIAAELVGRYRLERRGLPAIALNTDTSALTAIGNDYGYDRVFSRQVEALGRPGDVAIGISTSGNSPNIVAALTTAREIGLQTIALTGGRASACQETAHVTVRVPETETARIQECHIFIGHVICEVLDNDHTEPYPAAGPNLHRGVDSDLLEQRAQWRARGSTVVLTNGCFDMLHPGHLSSLQSARQHGDVLVVAVNSDASARRLKGPDRPIVGEHERAVMLLGLSDVDQVVIFDDDSAAEVVRELRPDVWCKGEDYRSRDRTAIPEIAVVEEYGGTVEFLPLQPGHSTTSYIDRIRLGAASR